jgi:putative peptide zinc metalloprotease protein
MQFILVNQLVLVSDRAAVQRLVDMHERSRQHWFTWLLHHYLFIKISLWRPDAFLDRAWPWVSRWVSPRLLWTLRAMGLIGLLMVLQQWDVFLATFLHFLSWQGLALYGLTLAVVKSAHELGHAFVAKKYGCKVGSIGVAFLLMFPVLYTDTTDAWRLRSSKDRLRIVVAGVATELHLAMLATFAWSFLPDGPLRSVAFFVGTTSWVTSLLVNLSPFMRFDGYFAFSDALQAENLQPRSFALARWHLREMLFGLGEAIPESLSYWRKRVFIAYAYGTWIYRLSLFLGIAALVYHFAFKLLGIFLFAIEIGWFIFLPMKNELMQWWARRQALRLNRNTVVSSLSLLLLALAMVFPWQSSVSVPGVLLAGEFRPLYASEAGQIAEILVGPGTRVQSQARLIRFVQPDLEHAISQATRELELVQEKLQRQAGSARDLQDSMVLAQQKLALQAKLHGLQERTDRLTLTAPIKGQVSQMDPLQTGQWVSQNSPVLTLRSEQGLRVMALVPSDDLHRIEEGAQATWISDLPGSPRLELKLSRIDQTAVQNLLWPELASEFGGSVPVRKDAHQQLRPEGSWYQIELVSTSDQIAPTQQQAGKILIQAKRESVLGRYLRYGAATWIRESGF